MNPATGSPSNAGSPTNAGSLVVFDVGLFATVQDNGRPGFAHLAVGPCGAADQPAFHMANRIVGNAPGAAVIESILGGLRVRAERATVMAVTGAPVTVSVNGVANAPGQALHVPAGGELTLGTPATGLRTYVAARGGLAVDTVLGSRSTDTLSGLGPPPLSVGDRLPVGTDVVSLPAPDLVPMHPLDERPIVEIRRGPRHDWLDEPSQQRMVDEEFVVTDQINRIGVRCRGPLLHRAHQRELPSEAILTGAVQLPQNGEPIIFGPDHPTTGGYPVVAVVVERHLPTVAQLRPGQRLRFRWVG